MPALLEGLARFHDSERCGFGISTEDTLSCFLLKNWTRIFRSGRFVTFQAVLRTMLNAAIEDGLLVSNPAANLGKTFKLTVSKSTVQEEIKAMTKDQRRVFLATAYREAPRYYPIFFVLAGTGMRLGEALALQAEDVDLHAQSIRIARAFFRGWGA